MSEERQVEMDRNGVAHHQVSCAKQSHHGANNIRSQQGEESRGPFPHASKQAGRQALMQRKLLVPGKTDAGDLIGQGAESISGSEE